MVNADIFSLSKGYYFSFKTFNPYILPKATLSVSREKSWDLLEYWMYIYFLANLLGAIFVYQIIQCRKFHITSEQGL